MFLQVAQAAYAASGQFVVEASRFPQRGPGGFSYTAKILIFSDYTDIDNAGGAVTPIELHDLINDVTLEGAGNYFGPKGLSGSDLSAVYRAHSGRTIGYHVTDEGDSNVGAGTNSTRNVLEVYDFSIIGAEPGDAEPLNAYLAGIGARLTVRFSALPTNATNIVGTTRVYVLTEEVGELRAVPPVTTERQGVAALTNHTLAGGKLVSAILKRNADISDDLITSVIVRADGELVVQVEDPEIIGQLATLADVNHEDAVTQDVQEMGFAASGGTRPRFLQIWPTWPHWMDKRLGKRPSANAFQATIGPGTLTAADYTWITTTQKRLQINQAVDQFAACGCARGEIEERIARDPAGTLRPKTHSKSEGLRQSMWGYTSVKLASSDALKMAGL